MAHSEYKLVLSNEELQLPALEDLCDKYREWLRLSKESKTRSGNKRADKIYENIMNFSLPPLHITQPIRMAPQTIQQTNGNQSIANSDSGDSSSSTRSLRPRCRTPPSSRSVTPSTPMNQRIRSHMKQQPSSGTASGSSSASGSGSSVSASSASSKLLVAALNGQHPSCSMTKIRQLLRADSAQKKRDQEREKQEKIRLDRKAKEERAEAQKRQLLEERAITAKQKRENRLIHAAEVRKARELAKIMKINKPNNPEPQPEPQITNKPQAQLPPPPPPAAKQPEQQVQQMPEPKMKKPAEPTVLNETFKKNDVNNIEIVIHDTSNSVKGEVPMVADWARAPHLRAALVEQYTNPNLKPDIKPMVMPVDLECILGKSVSSRHLQRTSSAVWTPPRKSMRRSNSTVSTPNS